MGARSSLLWELVSIVTSVCIIGCAGLLAFYLIQAVL